MEFRRLQHFVHVAELGNLSRAAERLHVVQPALSQSIKRLEEELNVTLFTRSKRGMELTEAGEMFLKSAYGILNQYNRARENVAAIGKNPTGLVSVAMTASAMHVLTVPICTRLKRGHPGIKLNIEEGLAANIQQGLEAGMYDFVVSHMAKADESHHVEDLIEEELFLASAYDNRADRSDIDFIDLRDLQMVLPQDQHGVIRTINRAAADLKIEFKPAQVTAALHPTMQLVEAGYGHSLLPWSAMYDRVAQKLLSVRKVVKPRIHHTVSMISPCYRPLSQATLVVMDVLRTTVRAVHEEGKWPGTLLVARSGAK